MQTIQAFKTSDGKLFDNKQDAELYESSLGLSVYIEQFFDSKHWTYKTKTYRNLAEKFITKWEMWKLHQAAEVKDGNNS